MDGQYYNLWSTDNDRTDANDEVVIKSVYDPSPVGYSLPASNAFSGFTTTGQNAGAWNIPGNPAEFNVKGNFDKGWYFYRKPNKQGETLFFYAVGYREFGVGLLSVLNNVGYYWNSITTYNTDGGLFQFQSNFVGPLYGSKKARGFPVRSAEEKVLKCALEEVAKGVWIKGGLWYVDWKKLQYQA